MGQDSKISASDKARPPMSAMTLLGCAAYVCLASGTALLVSDIRLAVLSLAVVSLLTAMAALPVSSNAPERFFGFVANALLAGLAIGVSFAFAQLLGQHGASTVLTALCGLLLVAALEMFLATTTIFALRPSHDARSLAELVHFCLSQRYNGAGGWLVSGIGKRSCQP